MDAPQVIFIGDSVMAGHNVHYTRSDSGGGSPVYAPEKSMPYKLMNMFKGNLTFGTYQNVAIGGETTADILARFDDDVINQKPQIVVMDGGLNDVYEVGYSEAATIANLTAMFDKCVADGIPKVVMVGNIPYTKSDNTEAAAIESLNVATQALCDSYEIVEFVSMTPWMAKERPSAATNNSYDMRLSYVYNGKIDDDVMEAGTTTTTINATAHGLSVGQFIVQTSRDSVIRKVLTVPTADSFTVDAVTGQTDGDNFSKLYATDIIHPIEEGYDVMSKAIYRHLTR